jgi:hypothetical protein
MLSKITQTQRNAACFLSFVESRGRGKDMKVEGGLLWKRNS